MCSSTESILMQRRPGTYLCMSFQILCFIKSLIAPTLWTRHFFLQLLTGTLQINRVLPFSCLVQLNFVEKLFPHLLHLNLISNFYLKQKAKNYKIINLLLSCFYHMIKRSHCIEMISKLMTLLHCYPKFTFLPHSKDKIYHTSYTGQVMSK